MGERVLIETMRERMDMDELHEDVFILPHLSYILRAPPLLSYIIRLFYYLLLTRQ